MFPNTLKGMRNLISLIGRAVFRHCLEELLTRKYEQLNNHLCFPLKGLAITICVLIHQSDVMCTFSRAA